MPREPDRIRPKFGLKSPPNDSPFIDFSDAKCFMDLRRVIHNFVNSNQQLEEKTPAEMAEIILPLGRNRLLSLIRYLAKSRR